jgi:hypothetical protein
LFSLDIQLILSKKEIYGSQKLLENIIGGEKMEKTEKKISISSHIKRTDIDWAKYLDYTRFFEPGEINNITQDLFQKDSEEIK